jgi:hypothetical protein
LSVTTRDCVRAPRKRGLTASPRQMLLLAPASSEVPGYFKDVCADQARFDDLIQEMQTLRGRIYLEEGAIQPDQLTDGRHQLSIDDRSWHLLILDNDRVSGCARYHEHGNGVTFADLAVAHSAIACSRLWGNRLKASIENELALAHRLRYPYVELGGWALTEEIRATAEALRMALASYGLARALGGGVGVSTVTRRNGSASILRRMGGRSLEHRGVELPPYYDPQFRCEMEVLRFYSWAPNPRYTIWIEGAAAELRTIPVISRHAPSRKAKYSTSNS